MLSPDESTAHNIPPGICCNCEKLPILFWNNKYQIVNKPANRISNYTNMTQLYKILQLSSEKGQEKQWLQIGGCLFWFDIDGIAYHHCLNFLFIM